MQQIYSKICIRRVTLYFKSRLSEWSTPIFSVSCSFDYTGFIKEVQGRWVDVSYFGEKIIISIAAVVSGVVDSSGVAVIFFLVITRSLRMTLSICDLLGKIAG